MPLLFKKNIDNEVHLGIWRIEEEEDWFWEHLFLYPEELRQLSNIKGRRRIEWLAARHLIHLMSGRNKRASFYKDEYGKPHLKGSEVHISISHSSDRAAAIASHRLCGIDIQKRVAKITRLAHKFVNDEEAAVIKEATQLDQLHFYWGAKEALYKAYGRKELFFKENILIEPMVEMKDKGVTSGKVIKGEIEIDFEIYYEWEGEYLLVYALEREG